MRPCPQQMDLAWRDLVRALRGVWLSVLAMAAAGLLVRGTVSDAWEAWHVLLAQIAVCTTVYVTELWFTHGSAVLVLRDLLRKAVGRAAPAG